MKREHDDSRLLAATLDESANLTIHFAIDVSQTRLDGRKIAKRFAGINVVFGFFSSPSTEYINNRNQPRGIKGIQMSLSFIQAEMVKSFIVSGEYRQRFGL